MRKQIGLCVGISICIVIMLSVFQVNAAELNSKYATVNQDEWLQFDTENNRFIKLENFLLEIDECVENICKYLNLECSKRVTITFSKTSNSEFDNIHNMIIINQKDLANNIPQIAHEITHFLIMSHHPGLNEGLATYMQEKFGKNPDTVTLGYPVHSLAKAFLPYCDPAIMRAVIEGGYYPPKQSNVDDTISFYLFSYSFVKYLIENYGIEKFMRFFNNIYSETYQSVFGADGETIKNNWLSYINSQANADIKKWMEEVFKLEQI